MTYLVDVRRMGLPIAETVEKSPCRVRTDAGQGLCGFVMPLNKTFSDYSKAEAHVQHIIEHALDHHWYTSEEQLTDSILWCIEEPDGDLYEIELGEMQSKSTGGE